MAGCVVVAQVVNSLGWGGLERVVLDLCRGLDRARYRPVVVSLSPDVPRRPEFTAAGVPVFVEPQHGLDPRLPFRLAALFCRERVGLVHAHNFGRYFYAGPAARLARLPSLYTEHSNTLPSERALWLAQPALSRRADRVVCISGAGRGWLVARQGLAPERIEVVPNGIDVAYYASGERAAARAELGLNDGMVAIGTAGRMVPVKDHALLLRAFTRLREGMPSARLVLAGDGPLREATEALARELGIASDTQFLGLRQDVPNVLAALDVFCLPSRSEGLPLAILEAMAAGLPVVATAVGGVVESVEARVGRLGPAGDAAALAAALAELACD
ncbi:MAG: glycosyltransferase, partial [Armatimonadetes bacterium]|nr:glycosyltransferase [Armatimonadota bacterium]